MKSIRHFIVLTILVLVACGGNVIAQSSATDILVNKARSLEARGRADMASEVWKQILAVNPDNTEALTGLARYSEATGKQEDASKYASHLRKVHPEAIRKLEPSSPSVLTQDQTAKLVEAGKLAANKDAEGAMNLYREVFKNQPPPGEWSIAYYETMAAIPVEYSRAIASLRQLRKKDAPDSRYALALGKLLTYKPGTRVEGMHILATIPTESSSGEAARAAWRAALLWEKGNPAATNSLHAYLERYPDPELRASFGAVKAPRSTEESVRDRAMQAAYAALQADNLDEAELQFEQLRSQSPADPKILSGLGFVRMKRQDFAGAQKLFEEAKAASANSDRTIDQALSTATFWQSMQDANRLLEADELGNALASFQNAAKVRPDSPEALKGIAGTLMKLGQPGQAAAAYRKLTATDRDGSAWVALGGILLRQKDRAGALAAYAHVPATSKLYAKALYNSACANALLGNTNAAIDLVGKAEAAGAPKEWALHDPDLAAIRDQRAKH